MTEPSPPSITLAVLRALVEEFKAAAHDPATVHAVASKLHEGINALEKTLSESANGKAAS